MLKARRFSLLLLILGGYVWLIAAASHLELPSPQLPVKLYSTNLRHDLKLLTLQAIRSANQSIYLQIYGCTDPEILALLKKKAGELPITLFYDPSASPHLTEELLPFGIQAYPVRCSGLMHRKILVIDAAYVYVGTANFTTTSLKMHDNLSLGLYHPDLAQFLIQSQQPSLTDGSLTFFLLPDSAKNALSKLLSLINSSQTSLKLAIFTLTHPAIVDALIAAHERGVVVNLAIDYYSGRGASQKAISQLQRAGIEVTLSRGQQLLHHKWALIDNRAMILGSANWTEAAFTKNQDCLVILEDLNPELTNALTAIYNRLL